MTDNYQPQGIAPGIYFNLSNDDYHNDPALSHSGMTKVLISWQDYWVQSCHNPERKKFEPTEAMKFGERSGMYLLERDQFHEKYATFARNGNTAKGIYLSSVEYQKIKDSIECVLEVPFAREHFENGYPEVSVFWPDKETGIMLRCKIDYLRTFGAIDFKRIMGVDNNSIGRAVKAQGLDIQNWLYLEGIRAARAMLREWAAGSKTKNTQGVLRPFHGEVDLEWLEAFAKDEDLLFRFLFQRSTPPYIWEFRELEDDVLREGANATRAAIHRYNSGIKTYGLGRPVMGTGEVKTISQFHIPRRDYDYEH